MLSQRDKSVIINILDEVLGVGTSLKGNEQAHHCPFCHHHKKKLQINLETQQWHCWVCDSKGRKIQTLLKRLHVDSKRIKKVYDRTKTDISWHKRLLCQRRKLCLHERNF